jgi:hypothetical protein
VPKISAKRSVWLYGGRDMAGMVVDSLEGLPCEAQCVAYYAVSPHSLSSDILADSRLAAIICPTPSPFSHDANLCRSLAVEYEIAAVCGLNLITEQIAVPTSFRISERSSSIHVGDVEFPASAGLAGSDEAIAYLITADAVCYRPFYLYDDWLGQRIARGLEAGVGRRVAGSSSHALLDSVGRVWLMGGPTPEVLANWILANRDRYVDMLVELVRALGDLALGRWQAESVLDDGQFLAALDVNFLVAPFVGFPLYSLTKIVTQGDESAKRVELERRVAEMSRLLPIANRQTGSLTPTALDGVMGAFRSVGIDATSWCDVDVAAATVLVSDVRRIVIDTLRRGYPLFREHTRHRSLD